MFSLFSGIYSHYFSPTPLNILLLGSSNSGKTALLERVKVTEFHEPKKNRGQNINTASENIQTGGDAQRPATQQRTNNMTTTTMTANTNDEGVPRIMTSKRRLLACPTPFMGQKYMNHDDEEEGHAQDHHDDENATDDGNIPLNLSDESWSLPQSSQQQFDVRTSSLEDVLINTTNEEEGEHQQQFDDDNKQHNSNTTTATPPPTSTDESLNQHNSDNSIEQEFDLKKGAKMLPLDKIRPTIGCNLAKNVIIQNCVCKLFDVGGSMQELWPQYYNDADCVVFVVCNNNNNVKLLEQVRREIPDDVPFLIFVHDMMQDGGVSNNNNDLLPHYHSNLMRIHHGNAKTGEGVRDAFEWLVQCAKRQAQLKKTSK